MPSVAKAEIRVALPRQQVWDRLRDLSLAPYYVPGLTAVELTTPQHEGIGASRRVFQKNGSPMDETVVGWDEGYGFRLRLHCGDKPPTPFKEAWFDYRIADADSDQTLFMPSLTYELPWGAVGRVLDVLLFNRIARSRTRQVALCFKRHYETGEITNPAFRPQALRT
jgi:hypothetical protein